MNVLRTIIIASIFAAGSALAETPTAPAAGASAATGAAEGGVTPAMIAVGVGVVAVAVAISNSNTDNRQPTATPASGT